MYIFVVDPAIEENDNRLVSWFLITDYLIMSSTPSGVGLGEFLLEYM